MPETMERERYNALARNTQWLSASISLDLERAVEMAARRREVSKASIVRRALRAYLRDELAGLDDGEE